MDERRRDGTSEAAMTDDEPVEPSGRVVVLWLFIALSIATALALVYFASITEPEYRPRIYTALVGNLALPVIAWYVYKHLPRHRPPA